MPPIVKHGLGSSYDAGPWTCRCTRVNIPTRHRLFLLPKRSCICGIKFQGNFRISYNDIKLNDHSLLGKIHYQNGPRCVANAYVHALQIYDREGAILMKQDPSLLEDLDADELHEMFNKRCSEMALKGCPTKPIRDIKLVHIGLILKEVGLIGHRPGAIEPGNSHKIGDVTVIPKDDFESIMTALAEGEALVATFYSGRRFQKLKYGQIYRSYQPRKYRKNKNKKIIGHAVCLVGAERENGQEYLDILNSHRRFCIRRNSHRIILKSGVGRIRASDLKSNVICLSRVAADGDDEWRLQPQDAIVLNDHNRQLMTRSKLPQVVARPDVDDEMEVEDLDSCVEEPKDQNAGRSRGGADGRRCHRPPKRGIRIRRFLRWLW